MIYKIRWVVRDKTQNVKCSICGELLSDDKIPLLFEDSEGYKTVDAYCIECMDNALVIQSLKREGFKDEALLSELRKLQN